MAKELSPEQVYGNLSAKGEYEEANLDLDELNKSFSMTTEDYEYGKFLRTAKEKNWRILFNVHYDVLRELCDQLMVFKKQKISNHQGLFAFIILNFKELDLDWKFFEAVRTLRNRNKYEGTDVTMNAWKSIELQMDIYIKTLMKEIESKIKKL